jgi:fructose-1,6-bisphosphatase/inositol monophosphatase family enzyme
MKVMTDTQAPSGRLSEEVIAGSMAAIIGVFREVRPMVLSRAGHATFTDKTDGSPVTETDVEVERTVQSALAEQYPDLPVFGEESGYDEHNLPPACWLIDPIDGTKSFIENVPAFTSMAVLLQDEVITAAVIYNISTDVLYTARLDQGAYKDGQKVDLQTMPLPEVAWCKEDFIPTLGSLVGPLGVRCSTAPAGGGYGLSTVVDGTAAARFCLRSGGYVHDYAPGALLIREAGGVIIPIKDDVYTYHTRSFVACHPALAQTIQDHLDEIRALEA